MELPTISLIFIAQLWLSVAVIVLIIELVAASKASKAAQEYNESLKKMMSDVTRIAETTGIELVDSEVFKAKNSFVELICRPLVTALLWPGVVVDKILRLL